VFLTAFALLGILAVSLEPSVAREFRSLRRNATRGVHKVEHWLVTGPFHFSRHGVHQEFNRVGRYFSSHASGLAVQGATLAAELFVGLLLTLVLTFFFVKDANKIAAGLFRLGGERRAAACRVLGAQCWATITGYVRGATFNGLINGTLMALGVAVLGVPLPLPIGIVTFFGGYFPVAGSIVSGGLAALVALVANGPTTALVVIGITIAIHNIETYLIGPLVLGRAVHLHPVSVLLALAVGLIVAGVVGAFIAVPLTALATTIIIYYRSPTDSPTGLPTEGHPPPPTGFAQSP
jgi:predicted PurR-regulated permease PerM